MFDAKQKGLSPLGILFVVCVFAFTLLAVLKLSQHYMDYFTLRRVFEDMTHVNGVSSMTNDQLKSEIYKQLAINNIRDFNLDERAYFVGEDGQKVLGFNYEDREHMFANIDVVMSFKFEQPYE